MRQATRSHSAFALLDPPLHESPSCLVVVSKSFQELVIGLSKFHFNAIVRALVSSQEVLLLHLKRLQLRWQLRLTAGLRLSRYFKRSRRALVNFRPQRDSDASVKVRIPISRCFSQHVDRYTGTKMQRYVTVRLKVRQLSVGSGAPIFIGEYEQSINVSTEQVLRRL